jgi:Putative zinc-finger
VTGDLKKQTEAIREMIDYRLKSMSAESAALPADSHLDEDTISAFVEGRLAAAESRPVLSHLTACRSCRQASAQLLRLETEIFVNQIDEDAAIAPEEPGRLQAFIDSLKSLGATNDEVVFAYQNPEEQEESEKPREPDEGNSKNET